MVVRSRQTRASALRRAETDAERSLWQHVRNRKLSGAKFRRQQPIGPYIVDFFCPEAKLIIELDGSHHDRDRQSEMDRCRTRFLVEVGYRILRFWNSDVQQNLAGVLHQIGLALDTPHPDPLPQGAREQKK